MTRRKVRNDLPCRWEGLAVGFFLLPAMLWAQRTDSLTTTAPSDTLMRQIRQEAVVRSHSLLGSKFQTRHRTGSAYYLLTSSLFCAII